MFTAEDAETRRRKRGVIQVVLSVCSVFSVVKFGHEVVGYRESGYSVKGSRVNWYGVGTWGMEWESFLLVLQNLVWRLIPSFPILIWWLALLWCRLPVCDF